jgi:hypothetical protein
MMFQTNAAVKNKKITAVFSNFIPESGAVYETCGKIGYSQRGHR